MRESKQARLPKTRYYRGGAASSTASSAKSHPRASKIFFKRLIDMIILLCLGVLIFYCLQLKPSPKLIIDSSAYHPSSDYQAVANQSSGSIKNRNKLTYDEHAIITALESQFPEVGQVNITIPLISQRPTIKIHIDKPIFSLGSLGQKYIVDETGVVVPRGNINTAGLMSINDASGIVLKNGDHLLSPDNISFINQVVSQLKSSKIAVSSLDLPIQAQDLNIHTRDANYYVKFYLGGDPLTQAGQMLAARANFAKKNITPAEYLDVRVLGKIYYK